MQDKLIYHINLLLNKEANYDKIYNFIYSLRHNDEIMTKKAIISSIPFNLLNNNNYNFFLNRFKDITTNLNYQNELILLITRIYRLLHCYDYYLD